MVAHPGVHGDRRSRAGVDGPGGAELLDVQDALTHSAHGGGEAGSLLSEDEDAVTGQCRRLEGLGARQVVDADDGQLPAARPAGQGPGAEVLDGRVVLLQSRPETVWSQRKPDTSRSSYMTGLAGIVQTLNNPLAAKRSDG